MELMIFLGAAFLSYWYETELFLFFGSVFVMGRFFYFWYHGILKAWPLERAKIEKWVLGLLPAAAFGTILSVLLTEASYDVVGIWVIFYIVLGYAWIRGGLWLMECMEVARVSDVLQRDNKAALFPAAGGFLGISLIYAQANVGDGPGWWTVLIAAGIGTAAWLLLAFVLNLCARVWERVTVERDVSSGIRFGSYLLASGMILAKASGGDWTSLAATFREFCIGWPALPLTGIALGAEFLFRQGKSEESVSVSVLLGMVYVILASAYLWYVEIGVWL